MQLQVELGSLVLATLAFGGLMLSGIKLIIRDELNKRIEPLETRVTKLEASKP